MFPQEGDQGLVYKQASIPLAGNYITLQGVPGTNGLLLVFSRTQAALDELLVKVKEHGPSVVPVNYPTAIWEKNSIRFSDKGSLSSVLVELVQQ